MNDTFKYIGLFFLIISIIAFLVCGYDKLMAKQGKWRVPESRLVLLSLLGGGIGMSCGIYLFRHKTRHPLITIPAIYGAVQSVVILLFVAL